MSAYYVLTTDSNVSVKEGEFFRQQGGLSEPWGKNWQRIEACCLYDARRKGIVQRRATFPQSHRTLGENGSMREAWPEGYEGCCV